MHEKVELTNGRMIYAIFQGQRVKGIWLLSSEMSSFHSFLYKFMNWKNVGADGTTIFHKF